MHKIHILICFQIEEFRTNEPKKIGNKNWKLYFIFLKKFNTQFSNFSYMPKITHNTPLLMPGRIAPAPKAIPLKKLVIKFNILNSFKYKYMLLKGNY